MRAQRFATRARTILFRSHDASQAPGRHRISSAASGLVRRARVRAPGARLHQELNPGGLEGHVRCSNDYAQLTNAFEWKRRLPSRRFSESGELEVAPPI